MKLLKTVSLSAARLLKCSLASYQP